MIPTVTKQEFIRKICKRKYEDMALLENIEDILKRKRGYVFRLPKPGSAVILLASGGIDSTVAWYYLAQQFRYQVYPIAQFPPKYRAGRLALRRTSAFLQPVLGERYHEPLIVSRSILPPELDFSHSIERLRPGTLLAYFDATYNAFTIKSFSGLNILSFYSSLYYKEYLKAVKNIHISTMFCAVTARDGIGISAQTQTFIRLTNLYLMMFTSDPKLQISSLFFEAETGAYARKRDIISIGHSFGLPLSDTWSCYRDGRHHCGRCLGCRSRSYEFTRAGVPDQTRYESAAGT